MRLSILTVTIVFCTAILLNGCSREKPQFADFIGTWVTDNGGRIVLMQDSTCIVENLSVRSLTHATYLKSFIGKWGYRTQSDLGYNEPNIFIKQDSAPFYDWFYVSGQGLFNNRPPWYFFQYIGDPDDLNEYAFRKVQ